jgi:hypothetical protein
MPAYRGEYLLKNPFLGSSLLKRAKAGFQGAIEMQKAQEDLYQGALEAGAKKRSTYMAQIMPKHLAQKAQAEKKIDIHGYARAQQAIRTEGGKAWNTRKKKAAKEKGRDASSYEAALGVPRKRVEKVQERYEDQQRTVQGLAPEDRLLERAQAKEGRLESKLGDLRAKMTGSGLALSEQAERMHSGVMAGERNALAKSADIRNTFFGGSEFARDPEGLTHSEQMSRAFGSVYPGTRAGQLAREDPTTFGNWFNTRSQIEQAYKPVGLNMQQAGKFTDERMQARGMQPLNYASTAQGLFDRGTAFATRVHEGDESIYSSGSYNPNDRTQRKATRRFGLPNSWSKY